MGLIVTSGCAAIPAAQMGQTAGTIVGSAIVPGLGAPIGALVGLLAGMAMQGEIDKGTEKRERKTLGDQLADATSPAASSTGLAPQGPPTRVWVDETVRDGRLAAGHFDTRAIP